MNTKVNNFKKTLVLKYNEDYFFYYNLKEKNLLMYDCPHIIPIEAILKNEHVIPWFNYDNSYFINKFIF